MMIKNKTILSFFYLFALLSCGSGDDVIVDVPLNDGSGKIVIQGYITDEPGPYEIAVSRSVTVSNMSGAYPSVDNAKVILSDNHGQSEELKYDYLKKVYKTNTFHTTAGDTYTLSVNVDGVLYKSTSTMPQQVSLVYVDQDESESSGYKNIDVFAYFQDSPTPGNKYVFKRSIGSKDKGEYFIFSDELNNGQIIEYQLYGNYAKKDTVFVELRSVDNPVYDYFRILPNAEVGNSGNISTPANPPSNINNGALGYFSAHSVSKKKIIIE